VQAEQRMAPVIAPRDRLRDAFAALVSGTLADVLFHSCSLSAKCREGILKP
jgi:hypothetical protein